MVSEWLMKQIIEVHLHKVKPIVYHGKEYSGIVLDFENKISLTLHCHFETGSCICLHHMTFVTTMSIDFLYS